MSHEQPRTTSADLERAIQTFLRNDVTVESVCRAFRPAHPADREALPRLAAAAFGSRAPSDQVTSDLVALVDRWGSFTARQGLAGTLFVRLGRYQDALSAHVAALPETPRWHATSAYRVLDAIADDLHHLDRPEEAMRVAELALRWDPTNPSALLTLACASAKIGDRARAAAIHAYLAGCGYPMETWGAALGQPWTAAAPYVPDLQILEALSDEHWYRFRACNALHPFIDGEEARRAHAMACLQRGWLDDTLFALQEAPAWRSEGSPHDPEIVRIWASAQMAAIRALPGGAEQAANVREGCEGRFSSSSIQRAEAIDTYARSGDQAALIGMLRDPDRVVTMGAAKALFELGYDARRPLIEIMAFAEKKLDSKPPGLTATKLLAWFKKRAAPAPRATKTKGPLREAALVEKVIAAIQANGMITSPRPVSARKLAKLKLPGGKPLSPGLATFLAFDANTLGLFADPDAPRFEALNVDEVATRRFDRRLADLYEGTKEELPGACLVLGPQDGNRCDVLYVGEADGAGEYPVLTLDCDEGTPNVYVSYPGVDVYLASLFGVVAFAPEARKADDRTLDEHRRLNLGGRRALIESDDADG